MKKVVALLLALVALGASAAFAMKVPQAHVLFTVGTDVKSADVELLEEWETAAIELEKWLANPASRDMLAERAKSLNFSNVSPDSTLTVTLSEDPSIEPMICAVVASSDKLGKGKIADELNATVTLSEDMTVYVAVKTWRMPFAAVVKANVTMSTKKPEYKGTGKPHPAKVTTTDSETLKKIGAKADLYGGTTQDPVSQETANKVGEQALKQASEFGPKVTVSSGDLYVLPLVKVSPDVPYGVTINGVTLSTDWGVAFAAVSSGDVASKVVVIEDYDEYDEDDFDAALTSVESASFYTADGTPVATEVPLYPIAGIMNQNVTKILVKATFDEAGEVYPVLATFKVTLPTSPTGTSPKSGTSPVIPGGSASSHSGCDMGLVSGLAVLLAALLPLRKVRK